MTKETEARLVVTKTKTKTKTKAKIKTKTGSWLGDEGARWAIAVVVSPCKRNLSKLILRKHLRSY